MKRLVTADEGGTFAPCQLFTPRFKVKVRMQIIMNNVRKNDVQSVRVMKLHYPSNRYDEICIPCCISVSMEDDLYFILLL